MSQVYIIKDNSETVPMKPIRCANEDIELQQLLEKNPQLMPGHQIRPEDPRRWFLIRREMPVPDPGTGENRWSIGHFFVDQSGTPTFVECKRFLDTRSRREVVGQMMEYAANGQYYWNQEIIRRYASETAKEKGLDLDEAVRGFQPDVGESVDDFIEQIENNLQEGQVRLVFFMEEAPPELKSIVDFLNKQMERAEVLIIEAKQFENDGLKVVAPILFGFTEEARRVKKTVTVSHTSKRIWTEELFMSEVRDKFQPSEIEAIEKLLDYAKERKFSLRWDTGKQDGSFSIIGHQPFNKTLLSIYTSGWLVISFGHLNNNEQQEKLRDLLAKRVSESLSIEFPEDYQNRYPNIRISDWAPNIDSLLEILDASLKECEIPNG